MTAALRQRVMSRLLIDPSGCLIWTGAINHGGYGVVGIGSRIEYVHRLMYEWFAGPIPDGYQIDHLCRVRHCASPADLEAVPQLINILRGESPTAVNAVATHCVHGHPFDALNTYYRPGRFGRQCRRCIRERRAARSA